MEINCVWCFSSYGSRFFNELPIEGQGNFGSIDGDPAAAWDTLKLDCQNFTILIDDIENTIEFK